MFSDESKLSSMEQDQQLFNIQVSIIVAIYNVEPYLERCIRAIQCQTYKNLQIILVDDGSSDGCSEICDSFARLDSRITVIHKKNEGLVSARKTGLDIAGGGI